MTEKSWRRAVGPVVSGFPEVLPEGRCVRRLYGKIRPTGSRCNGKDPCLAQNPQHLSAVLYESAKRDLFYLATSAILAADLQGLQDQSRIQAASCLHHEEPAATTSECGKGGSRSGTSAMKAPVRRLTLSSPNPEQASSGCALFPKNRMYGRLRCYHH
jgi:hypothetical protein